MWKEISKRSLVSPFQVIKSMYCTSGELEPDTADDKHLLNDEITVTLKDGRQITISVTREYGNSKTTVQTSFWNFPEEADKPELQASMFWYSSGMIERIDHDDD